MSSTETPGQAAGPSASPGAAGSAASPGAAGPGAPASAQPRQDDLRRLREGFERSRKLLTALGDESRQQLVLAMIGMGDCSGARAVDVAERNNLSRPAVSHHLQIMKDAGLLKTRKEGTKVFYYFDPDMGAVSTLVETLLLAVRVTQGLPDRSGQEGPWPEKAAEASGEQPGGAL